MVAGITTGSGRGAVWALNGDLGGLASRFDAELTGECERRRDLAKEIRRRRLLAVGVQLGTAASDGPRLACDLR
jgi:hypothetical protein